MRRLPPNRHRRGVTLVEALVFLVISSMIAVFALRSLADGRVLRSLAIQRLEMLPIAQQELDRLVADPSTLDVGTSKWEGDDWRLGTVASRIVELRSDGLLEVTVELDRETLHGPVFVRLTTLVSQGGAS